MGASHFHVDIDAFFASVEVLDNPGLIGKPVIVGGKPGGRGVVSTCSYEARARGVRSAMPINEAYRICPEGIFLPPRMERYQELSETVFRVLDDFTPDVYPISIDEAFLDMTGTERLHGPPSLSATALKERVRANTGLTISIGVAPNRFVAKLASAASKPNGIRIVEPEDVIGFMDSLPLSRLWGAGERTQERFRELNIRSVPDLRSHPVELLCGIFGQAMGRFLAEASQGLDPGMYTGLAEHQSLSTERTFEVDVSDAETLETILLNMAQELMYGLYRKGMRSRTAQIKIRYADFRTQSAQRTVERVFLSTEELFSVAVELLRAKREPGASLRLLGLGLSSLVESGSVQGDLFGDSEFRKAAVERAAFSIEDRGKGKLRKARTLRPGPEGRGSIP